MVRAFRAYLATTACVRKTDFLSILPVGLCKGHTSSHSAIAWWIRQLLFRAYALKDKIPLIPLRTQSTRE